MRRFAWGYSKKRRIELTWIDRNECTPPRAFSVALFAICGWIFFLDRPTRRRNGRYRVKAREEQIIKRFRRIRAARKTTGHSDDGNGFGFLALQGSEL